MNQIIHSLGGITIETGGTVLAHAAGSLLSSRFIPGHLRSGLGRQRGPQPDQRPAGLLLYGGPFAAGVLHRLPVSCNFHGKITLCIKIRGIFPFYLLQLQNMCYRAGQKG